MRLARSVAATNASTSPRMSSRVSSRGWCQPSPKAMADGAPGGPGDSAGPSARRPAPGTRAPLLREHLAQRLRERHGAGLIAVDAQRVGRHRDALAAQAGDIALLDHAEHLLHRGLRVLDHAARLVARRERAVVGVAPVREYLAIDRNVLLSCCFHHQGIRKRIEL